MCRPDKPGSRQIKIKSFVLQGRARQVTHQHYGDDMAFVKHGKECRCDRVIGRKRQECEKTALEDIPDSFDCVRLRYLCRCALPGKCPVPDFDVSVRTGFPKGCKVRPKKIDKYLPGLFPYILSGCQAGKI